MRCTAATYGLIALLVFVGLVAGCGERAEIGPLVEKSQSVKLGGAREVDVEVEMGAGKLSITGGARNLMDAEFIYNVVGWDPEVDYSVSGDRGNLVVRRPLGQGSSLGRGARYEWDLMLSDDVPMNLDVELGAGGSRIDIGSLDLEDLDVTTGAGEVEVYLTGRPSVKRLSVETGAGDVTVDLTGRWSSDLEADIMGGVGRLRLLLPVDVGVRVEAGKGLGKITARGGFTKEGDVFTNEAYRDSEVTLDIDCGTGIGAIILELEGSSDVEGVTI
jgi:hypothetical protein